ncbi:uncharacterized protein RHO25_006338 [Cercospora beticola]|nr:hypothetical protein RHO25_006338 [Cercospora beticola]
MFFAWAAVSILSGVQMGRSISEKDNLKIDADIAGTGVLIGLFTPAMLTALNLVLGHFHSQDGGILEIGAAHFANLSSLLINTLKALWCGSIDQLSEEERLIAAISINLCCTSLRMSFSDKTALASRSFMALSSVSRLFGLICMFILLGSIGHASAAFSISTLHWYGAIRSHDGTYWSVWALLATNCMIWMSDTLLVAYRHTPGFDKAHKAQERNTFHAFPTLRTTALLKHVQSLPVLVMDMWAIMALAQGSDRGSLADWGQSAALATALTTIAHWGYRVLYDILWKSWHNNRWLNFSRPSPGEIDAPLNDTGYWPREAATKTKQELQEELLEACRTNDITWFDEIMQQLEDEDINFVDQETNRTPLLIAIENGSLTLIKELKENHQASSAYLDTEPAVVRAVELGRHNILTYLIFDSTFTEDPCQLSRKGTSPLQLACQSGHWAVVEVLLRHPAVTKELTLAGRRGPLWTALTLPQRDVAIKVSSLLLYKLDQLNDSSVSFDALVDLIRDGNCAAIQSYSEVAISSQPFPMNRKDSNGWTLLHWAAWKGDMGILEGVLRQMPGTTDATIVNEPTCDGRTALHVAAQYAPSDLALRLLELPTIETGIRDHTGRSALPLAAQFGALRLVQGLRKSGERPLNTLISEYVRDGVKYSSYGPKRPHFDHDIEGRTPLSYAVEQLHFEIMDLLLETGADPFIVDTSHKLPLAYAYATIRTRHPSSQSCHRHLPSETSWPEPSGRTTTENIVDAEWRSLERFVKRWMPSKERFDIDQWKTALKEIADHGMVLTGAKTSFIEWLCCNGILDPTTKTMAGVDAKRTASCFLDCLLYYVAEHRLRGLAVPLNHFKWSTHGADMSYPLDEFGGPCVAIYAAKAIELGHLHHAKFLVGDVGIDINTHEGLLLHAAVQGQRVDGVAWVLN